MATMEEVMMAWHTIRNIEGLRDDMRKNAERYKAMLLNNRTAADVLAVLQGDVTQYIKRIKLQEDILDAPARRARLITCMSAIGITDLSSVSSVYNGLKTAAQALNQTTEADIDAKSDQLLANVAAGDRVFGG